MLIYYIVFTLSIALLVIGEKLENKNKYVSICIKMLAIYIPALLAGMRSMNIGTDTKLYIEPAFNDAINAPDFFTFYKIYDIEFLYMLFTFIMAKIFQNVNIFMTVLYFITTFLVYKIASDNKEKAPMPITYAFFLLLYYNKSLNLVRQTIAILLIIYGLKYVRDKKHINCIITILIAFLIHKTSIIGLPIYLIYMIFNKKNTKYYKIAIFSMCILFLIIYKPLLNYLINDLHLLNSRYNYYICSNKVDISLSYMLFNLFLMSVILFYNKKLIAHDKYNEYLIFITLLGNVLMLLSIKFNFVIRISYYFTYVYILIIPEIVNLFNDKNKNMCIILMIIMLTAYNYIYYGFQKNDQTSPYTSIFEGETIENEEISEYNNSIIQ